MAPWFKSLTFISVVAAILGFALMTLRIWSVLDYGQPLQLTSTVAEWESLFAVWKVINGQELFTDRLKIPFNAVIYNWLFYNSYAFFTGLILSLFSLGDEWLPTVARHLTLIGTATAFVAASTIFLRLFDTKDRWTKAFCFAFAAYVTTGPLFNWWGFTTRPDVWAFALEIVAVSCFLKYYPSRKIHAVLLLAVFCYLAWSFKQINVYAVGGAGLYLLLRRDWSSLAMLTGVMIALWGITLVLGGENYIENVLFADFTLLLAIERGFLKLSQGVFNTIPSLVMLGALFITIIFSPTSRRILARDNAIVFAGCGLFVTSVIVIPASFHSGSDINYYFTYSFFMALMSVAAIASLIREKATSTPTLCTVSGVGWGLFVGAILLIFSFFTGVTHMQEQHLTRTARIRCMENLPRPVFIDDSYYGLPWVTPGNIPFVVSYQYLNERKAGKKFEANGIGGLISSGKLKALAFMQRPPPETYDGASLDGFIYKPDLCAEMSVLLRKPE